MKTRPDVSAPSSPAVLSRRQFARLASLGAVAVGTGWAASPARAAATKPAEQDARIPLKIGHRAASMKMVGNFEVFQVARQMPGVIGVELQVAAGKPNLWDADAVRRYKREANRWGMMIPSLAGIWDPGVSILKTEPAEKNLTQAIRVAEMLGSSVVLLPSFQKDAPDMGKESSYGPVVHLLQRAAPRAADAGITLGLENSLSPSDNLKLVDQVDHPSVRVYYDPYNMARFGHADQAIPGIKLLGKDRICQVHVKNGQKLLGEPGLVDWPMALKALNDIGYEGWYVFESDHPNHAQLIEATANNIAFLRRNCQMPFGRNNSGQGDPG